MEKPEEAKVFGYCDYHEEDVTASYLARKNYRCFDCYHYQGEIPYSTVPEAAEMLGVSETTVRRLIKAGKLKAVMMIQNLLTWMPPGAWRRYYIKDASLAALAETYQKGRASRSGKGTQKRRGKNTYNAI